MLDAQISVGENLICRYDREVTSYYYDTANTTDHNGWPAAVSSEVFLEWLILHCLVSSKGVLFVFQLLNWKLYPAINSRSIVTSVKSVISVVVCLRGLYHHSVSSRPEPIVSFDAPPHRRTPSRENLKTLSGWEISGSPFICWDRRGSPN